MERREEKGLEVEMLGVDAWVILFRCVSGQFSGKTRFEAANSWAARRCAPVHRGSDAGNRGPDEGQGPAAETEHGGRYESVDWSGLLVWSC